MNKQEGFPEPSKRVTNFFRFLCSETYYEELQGDLEERYYLNCQRFGVVRAQKIYTREVIKMCRPSVVKKVKRQYQPNNFAMFKNYTTVAFRTLVRNKLFSLINVTGLAVSMAVGLLAIAFVNEINSYDKFHEKADRIYRVNNTRTNINRSPQLYSTSSVLAGKRLQNDFTGYEKVVSVFNNFHGDLKSGDKVIGSRGLYVGEDFLEVFTFPLASGNSETALKEPYSTILTEELALKIFNKTDVVGEVLERNDGLYTVTGVFKKIPSTTHLKFEAIASLKTLESQENRQHVLNNWGTMWSSYVYVLMPKKGNLNQLQANLDQIAKEENAKVNKFQIEMSTEPVLDIFPGDGKFNQMSQVMPKRNVSQILILALVVLFSACFNYANLSIARSLKRAKEVGVRKVVGARRSQLFMQFISEAVLVSFISLLLAFGLFTLIRPEFLSLNRVFAQTTTLELSTQLYVYFISFAILIGLIAGLIPALLISKFKTISVLKGISGMSRKRSFGIRSIMIALQLVFSMGFATLITMSSKQYNFATNFDLGFDTENILNIYLYDNDVDLMKSTLSTVAGVQQIASSSFLPSVGSLNSDYAKVAGSADSAITYNLYVDSDYLETLNHELVAGENFTEGLESEQMIVNETLAKEFDLGNPNEAIGKRINFYGKTRTIVGVVKDFHYGTIYNTLSPFTFLTNKGRETSYLSVKVQSADMVGTIESLEKAWASVDSDHDLRSIFFDDQIRLAYGQLSSSMKTYGLLAFVAISISMLGLLGMAVYNAESRIKELTIRKVLGASMSSLTLLLSRNFVVIFVIAAAIAIPLSYSIFKNGILKYAKYSINIGFWELGTGALIIILISFLTIASQTMRAARSNPSHNLRNE